MAVSKTLKLLGCGEAGARPCRELESASGLKGGAVVYKVIFSGNVGAVEEPSFSSRVQ